MMATTSADSVNNLPTNYSVDQLKDWIKRKLGYPVWSVEITNQQILDAIKDSVDKYSQYRPKLRYRPLKMYSHIHAYFKGEDLSQGVVDVQFLEPNPVPTEIFYGNLIDPAPIFRTGVDEYDTFLRWRKTWMRVTSVRPDWFYDDVDRILYVHNPIERYDASVWWLQSYNLETINRLDFVGQEWVRNYALAKSTETYGVILQKYSGAIPGPVRDLQLDQSKKNDGGLSVEKLEQKLLNMQIPLAAITQD